MDLGFQCRPLSLTLQGTAPRAADSEGVLGQCGDAGLHLETTSTTTFGHQLSFHSFSFLVLFGFLLLYTHSNTTYLKPWTPTERGRMQRS